MDKLEIARKYFKYQRQDAFWQYDNGVRLTKTVVEIPARAGSTRIKDKNIREVCGIPLLALSIRFALSLDNVDRVIVNTDNPEYASIAREYGAETPFLRPSELSGESAPLWLASFFLKRHLMDEGYPMKKLVTFLPSSPFRNKKTVQFLMSKLDYFYTVNSAFKASTAFSSIHVKNDDGSLRPLKVGNVGENDFFIKKIGVFNGVNVMAGAGLRSYTHLTDSPFELIDVDTEEDFIQVDAVLRNKLYDFGCTIC